jgi:glycosyltransferase involved in cell wall biosynthesis
MIIVNVGHVPVWRHHHRGLFEAFAREHIVVYVEKMDSLWRAALPPATAGVPPLPKGALPARGLFHYPLRPWIPLQRLSVSSQCAWWLGLRRHLRSLRRRSRMPIALVLQTPLMIPTFRGLDADLRVYQVIDDYVGLAPDPVSARRTAESHRRSVREADIVWATSENLAEDIRPLRPDVKLSTNGVDFAKFSSARERPPRPEVAAIPSPRIGLIGVINDRTDWALLEAVVGRRREWNFLLVGPVRFPGPQTGPALERMAALGNVHRIEGLAEDELPSCIAGLDTCLIAYRPGQGTLGINPLKLYQYLAVGKPVVSTPLPGVRDFGDVIRVAETADEFEAAIASSLPEADSAPKVSARQRRVRVFDWSVIAADRLAILTAALEAGEGRGGRRSSATAATGNAG